MKTTLRNFATATMLTLGVLGVGACTNSNSTKEAEQNNTNEEVITKEAISKYLDTYDPKTPTISREMDSLLLIKNLAPEQRALRSSKNIERAQKRYQKFNGDSLNKTSNNTQTEVISAEGDEALKATTLPNQPIYSKEPNQKLTEKTCNLVKPEEVELQMANINGLLDAYGTFAGTVEMQRAYNYHIFIKKLEDCIANKLLDKHQKSLGMNIHSFPSEEAKKFYALDEWINESYYATSRAVEQEAYDRGQKDARFVSELMDSHFASIDFLSKEEKNDYKKSLLEFRNKQNDKYSVQGYSDYIAFQVFTMDRIMYKRAAKNMGFNKLKGFDKAFAEFEKAAAPTP